MGVSMETVSIEKSILTMPVGAEKVGLLTGNYDLAAAKVFQWHSERSDYITAKGAPARDDVYNGEKEEYEEAKDLLWAKILSGRDLSVPWYDDPLANDIWTVASESADVAIVGASELQQDGYDAGFVAKLLRGDFEGVNFKGWLGEFQRDIREIQDDLGCVGVDLAEAILLKSSINEQHYPSAFLPWVMINKIGHEGDMQTFARRLRAGVGKTDSSQMPDLSMTWMGESTLSRAQRSPFGSNGSSPQAIYIRDQGQVEVAPSDKDNTYDGLYVLGGLKWLFDDREHRFHHEAQRADYRWYFSQPEWRDLLDRFGQSGIRELVVPSGSHFRFEGLKSLAKYINLGFENLGEVDDELRWKQYCVWCFEKPYHRSIFDFQRRVVQGKESRLDLGHDKKDRDGEHKGAVVAMDEIIVWFNKEKHDYEAIERPENEEDALKQIDRLISGEQFFISNATIVTALQQNGMGEGLAMQIIPMRIKCDDLEEREVLREKWLEAYRMAASKKGRWKVTPGGVSMLHDLLQPYQVVTIYEDLDKMVMPERFNSYMNWFLDNLVRDGKEVPYLELPEKLQNEIGIAVGGLSLAGLRVAMERFLVAKEKFEHDGKEDHDRLNRLEEIQEIMRIGSEPFTLF